MEPPLIYMEPLVQIFVVKGVTLLVELERRILRASKINAHVLQFSIDLDLVYGCHRMKGRNSDDEAAYFVLYYYPKRVTNTRCTSSSNGNGRTKRATIFMVLVDNEIGCDVNENLISNAEMSGSGKPLTSKHKANIAIANKWVIEINKRIAVPLPEHGVTVKLSRHGLRERKLLIIVNPHSGAGKAKQMLRRTLSPMLAEADIICKVVATTRVGHAVEEVTQLILKDWDGIVIISGDGLVFEVLNGLINRSDRDLALKLPIAHIPGGSGNAMVVNVAYFCEKLTNFRDLLLTSALYAIRPSYMPMKLVHVQTPTRHMVSFMQFGWGIISDIDIESERFRKTLGALRFYAGAAMQVFKFRTYPTRVSYIPVDDVGIPTLVRSENGIVPGPSGDAIPFLRHQNRDVSSNAYVSPKEYVNNGFSSDDETIITEAEPRCSPETIEALRAADVVKLPDTVTEPLSDEWTTIEGAWYSVYVVYVPYISSDAMFCPMATFKEDFMYLTLISPNISKLALCKMMIDVEEGKHVTSPDIQLIPCRAVRLEPLESGSYLTVDGELIPEGGPIQAAVSSYNATVMARHNRGHY